MNLLRSPARPAPGDVDAFLAWEDAQEGRHEFDGTRVVAMTGGSLAHQSLVAALLGVLRAGLRNSPYGAVQEMRLRIDRRIRYPDLLIFERTVAPSVRTLTDALVTFEVLSDETARIDRTDKLVDYALLPSLRRYVLLDAERPAVTVFQRAGAGEALVLAGTLTTGDRLHLPEVGLSLAIRELYDA